jgi:hypothetical protein
MSSEQYNLQDKSDTELHAWLAQQKPGTDAYHAAEEETMRRVARIEELIERSEAPVRKREKIAVIIAVLALAAFITYTVLSYQ